MDFNTGPMAPESKLLLEIIKGRRPFCFQHVDFETFGRLVDFHSLAPLIFMGLQDQVENIPRDIYENLKTKYWITLYRNRRFWNAFLNMREAFSKKNVPILPLKGVDALARSYPVVDLRSMSDIDILVREEDLEEAEKIFLSLGYTKNLEGLHQEYWRKHQCHIVFCKDDIKVDAHWILDFKRKRRVLLPHLLERARTIHAGGHTLSVFSPEDALFSYALHWRRFGNILTLKQVLDVAGLIQGPPGIDWDYILKECKRGKMKATIYFILMQAYLFCGAEIPEGFLKKLKVPFWRKVFVKKFLLKHTFALDAPIKETYLKAHFLLYDNILESVLYVIRIPYEQFCKFYRLEPYTRNTDLRYRLRIPYMALSLFSKIFFKKAFEQDPMAVKSSLKIRP